MSQLHRLDFTSSLEEKTKLRLDLPAAEAVLEEDHYGLEKIKERMLSF